MASADNKNRGMKKKEGLPEWGEFVLVTVHSISPYAAWCKLDEYENVEGMIHVSEAAGKWVHDIREFVKVGKQYVTKVVKIDYQKNHVNLSLKRVTKYDEKQKRGIFRREQKAEKMLQEVAKKMGQTLEQAREEVGQKLKENFGEIFAAFDEARKSKEELLKVGIPEKWVDAIADVGEKSFQQKEVTIKAELTIKIYSGDGVEKIKQVVSELMKSTGAKAKYISAPKYRVEVTDKDPKVAEKKLIEGLETAVKAVKQSGGESSYKLVK